MAVISKRSIKSSYEAKVFLMPYPSPNICPEDLLALPPLDPLEESRRMRLSMLKRGNKRFEVVLLGAKNMNSSCDLKNLHVELACRICMKLMPDHAGSRYSSALHDENLNIIFERPGIRAH